MNVTTIGIDLAKNVFQVHGVDSHGHAVLRKQLKRPQLLPYFGNLPPCLIGMESCCGSHFFARRLESFGHTVKLIAPQFVKPYVKTNKNDAADAEAICEAVARPNMRFVPAKNIEQQAVLMMHRAREGFVRHRTAQVNQLRGLLMEFGIVFAKGIAAARAGIPRVLADETNELPVRARHLLRRLFDHLCELDRQVKAIEEQLQVWHRDDPASQRLRKIPGIGFVTATALVASIGDAKAFKNGRQFSAWLGLVPKQYSSGGKQTLGRISKRGDAYVRKLLVVGARAVLRHLKAKPDQEPTWIDRLVTRRRSNIAAVALANKNARIVWALLAHDREYQADYRRCHAQAA
jgi:transposase